jgi:membrane carboxypeptidase/penicillin-binding protein
MEYERSFETCGLCKKVQGHLKRMNKDITKEEIYYLNQILLKNDKEIIKIRREKRIRKRNRIIISRFLKMRFIKEYRRKKNNLIQCTNKNPHHPADCPYHYGH